MRLHGPEQNAEPHFLEKPQISGQITPQKGGS
jgi:hypothetical protein